MESRDPGMVGIIDFNATGKSSWTRRANWMQTSNPSDVAMFEGEEKPRRCETPLWPVIFLIAGMALLAAMLEGSTVEQAAKKAGIGERTAYRYVKEQAFKDALTKAQQALFLYHLRILKSGVKAAIATPRFIDITSQARAASLNGLKAAVSSAATLANALQQAQGLAAGSPVTIEGVAISMANRYPVADISATGILGAMRTDPGIFYSSAAASVSTSSGSMPT